MPKGDARLTVASPREGFSLRAFASCRTPSTPADRSGAHSLPVRLPPTLFFSLQTAMWKEAPDWRYVFLRRACACLRSLELTAEVAIRLTIRLDMTNLEEKKMSSCRGVSSILSVLGHGNGESHPAVAFWKRWNWACIIFAVQVSSFYTLWLGYLFYGRVGPSNCSS